MPTPTEKRIIQQREAKKRGDILTPILESLLEEEVEPEDEEDFAFLDMLVRVRATPRAKGVFSPSMLGSCTRQAWFSKRGEEKLKARSPQTNGYFLNGNFIHFKWQFATWKAARKGLLELVMVPADDLDHRHPMFFNGMRPGVEVRVIDGDYGGTIDILPRIDGKIYVVDYKGINLIEFQKQVKKGAKKEYRRQIVGYADLAAKKLDIEIAGCLLVSESKAGPVQGRGHSPLALHETFVDQADFRGDVKTRLRTLRWYDHKDEMPPPACVSTRHMGFQECPFSRHCHAEVREVQRERESRARKSPGNLKVARPSRG